MRLKFLSGSMWFQIKNTAYLTFSFISIPDGSASLRRASLHWFAHRPRAPETLACDCGEGGDSDVVSEEYTLYTGRAQYFCH